MAAQTTAIAGIAFLSVDGRNFKLAGDLKYSPSKVKRESQTGQDSVHGFSEMPAVPYISGVIRDMDGLMISDLNAMRDVTVVCELVNGKTVTGRNMWTVDVQEVTTEDAKCEVKWEGFQVIESITQ